MLQFGTLQLGLGNGVGSLAMGSVGNISNIGSLAGIQCGKIGGGGGGHALGGSLVANLGGVASPQQAAPVCGTGDLDIYVYGDLNIY